jgi:putative ABC transport system ATP-binding protein
MTALTLHSISKSYEDGDGRQVQALQNIDLEIARGTFVILVGSNGSGKTTLLHVIAGSEKPDTGSIFLEGEDVGTLPEHRRAACVGRVFQDPFRGTVAEMTIEENLALAACRGRRFDFGFALSTRLREEIRERLAALGIGLEQRMHQRVATLSGGQRQIVTMLMATWHRPHLLLLDEHTAALDPQSAELVLSLTGRIVAEEGLTVVMVTHSMQHAVHFGERLIMMHRGQITLDISGTEKLRAQPAELENYFEELRRAELLDDSVAALLREQYI